MKITEVSVYPLRDDEAVRKAAGPAYSTIVQVQTDRGIDGVGCTGTAPGVIEAIINAPTLRDSTEKGGMSEGLKEVLVGEDPRETERLWDEMYQSSYQYGRRGVVIHAISALDMALWDIKGKSLNEPVYRLLGGSFRDKVPVYASLLFPDELNPELIKQKANRAREAGFRAVKFGWGAFGYDRTTDLKMVEAARDAVGDEVDLMIDVGRRWTPKSAIMRIKDLASSDLYWFEEPISADNIEGLKKVCLQSPTTRVVAGEKLETRFAFERLIEGTNIDGVQPDVQLAGGLTEMRRILDLAKVKGVPVYPHMWGCEILGYATAHVAAISDNVSYMEYCLEGSGIRYSVVKERLQIEDGYLTVPETPGLGLELNEKSIQKYLFKA